MKKLIYVSDFFADEIPTGGAELCDKAIIEFLSSQFDVQKIKCINAKTPNKDHTYIISNFTQLSPTFIDSLIENQIEYFLMEHDHKYCVYRNPFRHNKQLVCNCFDYNSKVHMLYTFAKAVFCQTEFHKNIIDQNVYCNTINVGSNLWCEEEINWLKQCKKNKSSGSFIIFSSPYPHKNTQGAIDYAEKNNLKYILISGLKWKDYIETLSNSEGIIFFPILAESASRLAFEAKVLGKRVITNKLVGYTWEKWWNDKEVDIDTIISCAKNNILSELNKQKKDVSVFCTTFNSEKYIKGYLENVSSFKDVSYEVVIYDGGSTDGTVNEIKNFIDSNKKQDVIRLFESKSKIGIYKGWNRALSKCSANLVVNMNADDRFSETAIYELKEFLEKENVDLVYSDSFVTEIENETFDKHTKTGELVWPQYDKELLKKMCFCGHYPMFKKSILFKTGLFNEQFKSAADWDMWIRMTLVGANLKKLNKKLGLYLFNKSGTSTTESGASQVNIIESNFIRQKYSK
jgi:GT2 family glycosyltransferase